MCVKILSKEFLLQDRHAIQKEYPMNESDDAIQHAVSGGYLESVVYNY